MRDKILKMNWELYSKFILLAAQILIMGVVLYITFHTKNVDNTYLSLFYLMISAISLFLMKFYYDQLNSKSS